MGAVVPCVIEALAGSRDGPVTWKPAQGCTEVLRQLGPAGSVADCP